MSNKMLPTIDVKMTVTNGAAGATAGTDGVVVAETRADVAGIVTSEADGDIDFTVTVLSGKVAYLIMVLPDGRLVASDVLTYAT